MKTPRFLNLRLIPLVVAAALLASACIDDSATPIQPGAVAEDPIGNIQHSLEPTEQMRDAAEQQCLDDPDLVEGYVRAVDPATEQILSEAWVFCSEVRG